MLKPTKTFFDRNAQASNLLFMEDWRKLGHSWNGINWKTAMHKVAEIKGGCFVHRPDDSLIVMTKLESGKIRQTTYKPGKWGWA